MIREIRDSKITRKEVYAKYFSLLEDQESRNMTETFAKDIIKAKEIFDGKKVMNLLIKGSVFTPNGSMKYFTFVDEMYNIDRRGLENALTAIDKFGIFMDAILPEKVVEIAGQDNTIFFSEPEQEFVARKIVANALIIINIE